MDAKWENLPSLSGRQSEILYLPAVGHCVVNGVAGSGKTTLALYRAVYLSDEDTSHGGKTLLVVFNNVLKVYLNKVMDASPGQFEVDTYHTFVCTYLRRKRKIKDGEVTYDINKIQKCIKYSLVEIKSLKDSSNQIDFFKNPVSYFMNEICWILSHGISRKRYMNTECFDSQGSKISHKYRGYMYDILEKYIEIREQKYGILNDKDDVATHAKNEFKNEDDTQQLYKHIVIDEGQDFSPEMIRSLLAAVQPGGSLTYIGDDAQQLYGYQKAWLCTELKIEKPWILNINYRNPLKIEKLGIALSAKVNNSGDGDLAKAQESAVKKFIPSLIKCKNHAVQVEYILGKIEKISDKKSVAIICEKNIHHKYLHGKLGEKYLKLDRHLQEWEIGKKICCLTYHAAKGLEFDLVFIPFLEHGELPDPEYVNLHGEEEGLRHYNRRLYIAATRAKSRLYLLYSGSPTKLLPRNRSLYRKIEL